VATTRWFTEAEAAQGYCFDHASRFQLPVLVLAAGDDRIVDVRRTQDVFDALGSKDKRMIVYPGYYHEIFNETGRQRVFDDLDEWLGAHVEGTRSKPNDGAPAPK